MGIRTNAKGAITTYQMNNGELEVGIIYLLVLGSVANNSTYIISCLPPWTIEA